MIEIGAALLILACMIAFLVGCNENQTRRHPSYYARTSKQDLSTVPTPQGVMSQAEADFYAAYTYQETGEPSAFMLFDHEEPAHVPQAPQVVQTPKPKPKPKPRRQPVVSDDSQRIKDLESQLAKLQKVVKKQQQKPVKKTQKAHPLQQDCVDALVAIGYNKTEAKKIVKSYLTASMTSVQGFLLIAIRKA